MSGISISFGGQALKNGEGGFIVTSAGIAGIVSGEINLAVTGGSGVAGRLGLRINKTGGPVEETISVGGRGILIKFSATETDLFSFFAESRRRSTSATVTIEGSFVSLRWVGRKFSPAITSRFPRQWPGAFGEQRSQSTRERSVLLVMRALV